MSEREIIQLDDPTNPSDRDTFRLREAEVRRIQKFHAGLTELIRLHDFKTRCGYDDPECMVIDTIEESIADYVHNCDDPSELDYRELAENIARHLGMIA